MTNATQDKQRTAVELFNTGDEGTIRHLTQKLIRLLNNESDVWFSAEETKHLTLKEFQNNFEWDESYSVKASYGVEMLNDCTRTFDCPTKEDALAWVNGDNELEEPDLDDFYPEYEFNGEERISLVVKVSNLRLKTEQPKKHWKLVLYAVTPADIGYEEMALFLDECAATPSHFAQVLTTDYNEVNENWESC